MSSREGYHRKEQGRIDLERYKSRLLSIPWRLPTRAQTLHFEAAPRPGYSFEADRSSRTLHTKGSRASPQDLAHRVERHRLALEPVDQPPRVRGARLLRDVVRAEEPARVVLAAPDSRCRWHRPRFSSQAFQWRKRQTEIHAGYRRRIYQSTRCVLTPVAPQWGNDLT